jgi:hypothetical protein
VIIRHLDFVRAVLAPDEGEAPLQFDPYAVLAGAVATQRLQPVAGRKTQILRPFRRIERGDLRRAAIAKSAAMKRGRSPVKIRAVVLSAKPRFTVLRTA